MIPPPSASPASPLAAGVDPGRERELPVEGRVDLALLREARGLREERVEHQLDVREVRHVAVGREIDRRIHVEAVELGVGRALVLLQLPPAVGEELGRVEVAVAGVLVDPGAAHPRRRVAVVEGAARPCVREVAPVDVQQPAVAHRRRVDEGHLGAAARAAAAGQTGDHGERERKCGGEGDRLSHRSCLPESWPRGSRNRALLRAESAIPAI